MDRELYNATMSGDITYLNALVADRDQAEILTQVTHGLKRTVLHLAAKEGHAEFVSTLLKFKPSILFLHNSNGDTALHEAAGKGATEVVATLLDASSVQTGVRVEPDLEQNRIDSQFLLRAQNSDGNTALHMAAQGGYHEIADRLLTEDKELADVVNKAGEAPLFLAAKNGGLDIVKKLLDVSGPSCYTDNGGRTILHEAIHRKHLSVAKKLLVRRSELAKQADNSGRTPLHLAAEGGHEEIVREILKDHPKVCYAVNANGMSALHIAARQGFMKIVGELLASNPDCIEASNADGKTAMHLAIETGHWKVALYLLKNKEASYLINKPDKDGNTILHATMSRLPFIGKLPFIEDILISQVRMIRTLMEALAISKLSVNAENKAGQTALDIHDAYFGEFGESTYREHLKSAGAVHGREWRSASENLTADQQSENGNGEQSKRSKHADKGDDLHRKRDTLAIVAVLLATVTFAAAFTPPGGVDSKTGLPILVETTAFKAFVISDTVTMCLSLIALSLLLPTPSATKSALSRMMELSEPLLESALIAAMVTFLVSIDLVVARNCWWLALVVALIGIGSFLVRDYLMLSLQRFRRLWKDGYMCEVISEMVRLRHLTYGQMFGSARK